MLGPEAFVAGTAVTVGAMAWRTAVDSRNYLRAQKQKRQELGALNPTQFERTVEIAKSLVAGPGMTEGRSPSVKNPHIPVGGFREQQRREKTGPPRRGMGSGTRRL